MATAKPTKRTAGKGTVAPKKKTVKKKAKKKSVELTANAQKLLNQLLITPKIKDAAAIIGMPYQTARRHATKSNFIATLEAAQSKVAEKVIEKAAIDKAWVLKQAAKVHERCMQEEPVRDAQGNPTGEYKFEHAGANKALEIIGKHVDVQAFKETLDHTGKVDLVYTIEVVSVGPPKKP